MMATPQAETVLDGGVRLSQSILWRLQRRLLERGGSRCPVVPQQVSSSPVLARAYAELVTAWLEDWRLAGELDDGQDIHVIELGAGSGRFAYHFLSQLGETTARNVRYVATDITLASLEAMRKHPRLRPFVDAGRLDFALFDIERPGPLRLLVSDETVAPRSLDNPVAVIANYVFDGVPQDVFRVEVGELLEHLTHVELPTDAVERGDASVMAGAVVRFTSRPAGTTPYGEPSLDGLLAGYRARLNNATFSFPVHALRCLSYLADLAGDRMLMLSADKGYHDEVALAESDPRLAFHGSFSMTVNYHAMAELVRGAGGCVHAPPHRADTVDVLALQLGLSSRGARTLARAYEANVSRGGPDDFFTMRKLVEQHADSMTLAQALAWIRCSSHDPAVFLACWLAIINGIPDSCEALCRDLERAAHQVWAGHFPLGSEPDVALHLGVLMYHLGRTAHAVRYLHESVTSHGPTAAALSNLALCHDERGEVAAARHCRDRAQRLDPTFAAAARRV